jgi:hypothetical protein
MAYPVGGLLLALFYFACVFAWVGFEAVRDRIKRLRAQRRQRGTTTLPRQQPAPKYHAHGPDGSIIGTFDTILDAEICGLTAAGVKAVDLPLVLRERRRLGTYGSLRDSEPEPEPEPVLTAHWRCNTCGDEGPGYGSQFCQRCNSMFIEHHMR